MPPIAITHYKYDALEHAQVCCSSLYIHLRVPHAQAYY